MEEKPLTVLPSDHQYGEPRQDHPQALHKKMHMLKPLLSLDLLIAFDRYIWLNYLRSLQQNVII